MSTNQQPVDAEKFIETYYDFINLSINEEGVYPHQAMTEVKEEGCYKMVVNAMAINPEQVLFHFTKMRALKDMGICDNLKKIIFGLDRSTKENQGTTLNDVVTFWYWQEGEKDWRTGVIEYQNDPRIIKPINWDNDFWNQTMSQEVKEAEARFATFAANKILKSILKHKETNDETVIRRVGAILSADGVNVNFLGYGNYVGDHMPPKEIGLGRPNPKIILDNGKVVWGIECWWGSEEEVKKQLEGKNIVMVDIDEIREKRNG